MRSLLERTDRIDGDFVLAGHAVKQLLGTFQCACAQHLGQIVGGQMCIRDRFMTPAASLTSLPTWPTRSTSSNLAVAAKMCIRDRHHQLCAGIGSGLHLLGKAARYAAVLGDEVPDLKPVSYTHLDVYKRQVRQMRSEKSVLRSPSGQGLSQLAFTHA